MARFVGIVIVAAFGEAAAQPAPLPAPVSAPVPPPPVEYGFVGGGAIFAGDRFGEIALVVEGGIKLPAMPVWVRGLYARGTSFDLEGGGPFRREMIGVELRGCHRPELCGFLAFDAGYQTQTWNADNEPPTEHDAGLLVGPRVGVDVGRERLRIRVALDVVRYHDHVETPNGSNTEWRTGRGVTMTVVYRL